MDGRGETDGPAAGAMARAVALREAGDLHGALAAYRAAAAADPDDAVAAQHLGALLTQFGQAADGEAALRRALALRPDDAATRHALAINLMAQGCFVEAAPFYAARFAVHGRQPPAFPFPRWRGEEVAGRRIAIFPEQGFGDQIQYARFVPQLQARGAAVTLLAPPALVRLFADSFGAETVVAATGAAEFPDPDVWAMSSDLPALCGATSATLPEPPYLRTAATWPPLPPGRKLGLVTAGSGTFRDDARRSLPADVAARLRARLPGLVVGLTPEESGARDFADTAAIIAQLDLVVTVDTAVAHLAGALGRRCRTLLPGFAADWRWLLAGDASPWYPASRLYRATLGGDWTAAIDRLVAEIDG